MDNEYFYAECKVCGTQIDRWGNKFPSIRKFIVMENKVYALCSVCSYKVLIKNVKKVNQIEKIKKDEKK